MAQFIINIADSIATDVLLKVSTYLQYDTKKLPNETRLAFVKRMEAARIKWMYQEQKAAEDGTAAADAARVSTANADIS